MSACMSAFENTERHGKYHHRANENTASAEHQTAVGKHRERLVKITKREYDSRHAKHSADDIHDADGLPLGKSHIDQTVMEMSAVRREGTPALQYPADKGKRRIEQGQSENRNGRKKCEQRLHFHDTLNGHQSKCIS